MRFSTVSVILASALAVDAAVVPAAAKADISAREAAATDFETVNFTGSKVDGVLVRSVEAESDNRLVERQAAVIGAITTIGTGAMSVATGAAVNLVTDTLRAVVDWTKARETFTKQTTAQMWKTNPDVKKFAAAICYNKGYRVANAAGIDGKASVTLRSNVLHADYDCMYMASPNQFFTDGDGGLINLSYSYDSKRCSFDQATGDLTCK